MKIVINKCYGGFGVSEECEKRIAELQGPNVDENYYDDNLRSHPLLVQAVEELGDRANGPYAKLVVIEIPDDVKFTLEEYDGMESIHEEHREWH